MSSRDLENRITSRKGQIAVDKLSDKERVVSSQET